MYSLNRCGLGMSAQIILLAVLSFAYTEGFIHLSEEYLKDIQDDESTEQAAGEYNYDHQGDDWTGTCATGLRQSPIDLIYDESIIKSLPRIRFHNYDQSLQTPLVLVNNGHTANMVLPAIRNGQRASISGGKLPGDFEAQSVHFHWGSEQKKGSEHAVNARRYDVEMHIVHKNKKYANITVGEASAFEDGLAVLGVFFEAVARPRPNSRLYGLNKIFNQLPRITAYQSNATINGQLTVGQLLGDVITAEFFTYNGSLTTPDCAESVTWTVFTDIIKFPQRQINKLFTLQDPRQRPLVNTYRTLQEVNERPVYFRALNPF